MVQFFKGASNPNESGYTALADSLGMGIGNAIGSYYANRSLQSVLHDKSLQGASSSQKLQALQGALAPHGKHGQEALKNQLQVLQLEAQEKESAKQDALMKKKGKALGKYLKGEDLGEEEESLFTPQEWVAMHKARNPKTTQTEASQPIKPDQLKRMQEVRSQPEYQDMSPTQRFQALTNNGVSKQNAEAEAKLAVEEEKNKPGGEFSKLREKAVSEYTTNGLKKREDAQDMKYAIETARKAVNGQVQGPGIMAVIKNDPYGQLMLGLTPDEAELQAVNKKMLEGTRGIFGSKTTEKEIFLLLNSMLPSMGKSREANLAGLSVIEKANDLMLLHADLIDEITEGGSKYVPDLESQVNKRMKPMVDKYREDLLKTKEAIESEKSPGTQKPSDNTRKAPPGKVRVEDIKTGNTGFVTPFEGMDAKYKRL